MKKIALPTRNGNIDDHFGHCAFYTIITVNDNNEVAKTEIMPSIWVWVPSTNCRLVESR